MTFSFGLDISWQNVIDRERDDGEWFAALQQQLAVDHWVMSVGEIPTWGQLLA